MLKKLLDRFKAFTAILFVIGVVMGAGALLTRAGAPGIINYQGRVQVNGQDFTGNGLFKFALINPGGTLTYWGNDGTSTTGNEPTNAVTLAVNKGLYSVILGDNSITNMTTIPSTVFNNLDVRLRIWFNDGMNGSQALVPDQRITASGYAFVASQADTVADGGITTTKIADGAVTNAKIASVDYSKVTNAPVLRAPTVQVLTSGSGTYTTPAGVLYIRIIMAGGGGGGGGGGTTLATAGGNGGNTTFGGSLLVANGGFGGQNANTNVYGPGSPGAGGSASLGTGAAGIALTGGIGQSAVSESSSTGGGGGATAFGGAGFGGKVNVPGSAGAANTGAGGGGGGAGSTVVSYGGGGGGAGGYANATISNPSSTYLYSVGAGGPAGVSNNTGNTGENGASGGSGIIIVEEYYQ